MTHYGDGAGTAVNAGRWSFVEKIILYLRAQADRYYRLARELDVRGDGAFMKSMAAGYHAKADLVAADLEKSRR